MSSQAQDWRLDDEFRIEHAGPDFTDLVTVTTDIRPLGVKAGCR
jgi:hypothetical protein